MSSTDSVKSVLGIERLDLTSTGKSGPEGKLLVAPRMSSVKHAGLRQYKTVTPLSNMPTTALNGTARQPFAFDRNQFALARTFVFRFRIDVTSNTVRLAPTLYWFQYFTITALGERSQEVQRFYPESILALYAAMGPDAVESMAQGVGLNPKSFWLAPQVAAGTSVYMYLPVPAWFVFGAVGWNGQVDQSAQIQVDFYPMGSIVSSGSGTVSLGEAVLLLDTDIGAPGDFEAQKLAITRYGLCSNFLSSEIVTVSPQVMAASSTYNFSLINLGHKTAGLLVGFVANQNSNTANANQLYQSLGDSYGGTSPGSLDIVDTTGQLLFGGGTPLPAYHLKSALGGRQFCSAFNRFVNLYPVLFCSDIKGAMGGQVDDYFTFSNAAYQLRVTTPAAGTSETHTITLTGTSASGNFRLGWTSATTGITNWTAAQAYNTSAANLAIAFNALESVIQDRITATFSAAASAGTTITVTYATLAGQPIDLRGNLIQVMSDTLATSAPADVGVSVALGTQGVSGWVAGTYQPVIIALYWRTACKYSRGGTGLLRVTDL